MNFLKKKRNEPRSLYLKQHYKVQKYLLDAVLVALVLISCSCISLRNYAVESEVAVCKLHNVKMHKTAVRVIYGRVSNFSNPPEYPNAKRKVYMGCLVRRPKKYVALVYVCSQCNRARRNV